MNSSRWIPVVAALVLAAAVGAIAFHAGVAQGVAHSGKIVMTPAGPYPYYGWHPWGFGFLFVPLFFFFFFIVMVRGLLWGGWHHGGCRYRHLEEWHREAHERANHGGGTPQR